MDLRQLRYFVTLAEHVHFARAAEILDLAPSALTMQIQALERSLNVRLVNRTKRAIALTTAGRQFLIEARATLAQAERARTVAKRAARGELGEIRMAYVLSAACAGAVQRLLGAFHAAFPDVTVSLAPLDSPEQLRLLLEGALDACIVRTFTGDPELLQIVPLLHEPVVIALPADHPLSRKRTLRAKELAGERFIAPQFQPEVGFASHLYAIGSQAGFTPDIALHTRDFVSALSLVGAGLGIAAVPQSFQVLRLPLVVYRTLEDTAVSSRLSLVIRRKERSAQVQRLADMAAQKFSFSE